MQSYLEYRGQQHETATRSTHRTTACFVLRREATRYRATYRKAFSVVTTLLPADYKNRPKSLHLETIMENPNRNHNEPNAYHHDQDNEYCWRHAFAYADRFCSTEDATAYASYYVERCNQESYMFDPSYLFRPWVNENDIITD